MFDWRDTVTINVRKNAPDTAKTQAYRIQVHDGLNAVVILSNIEWADHQSWGTYIGVDHHTIKAKSHYNHCHNTDSIKEIFKVLTGADKARYHCKAMAPGETAENSSNGMESLH
jgi:hypothetical protein